MTIKIIIAIILIYLFLVFLIPLLIFPNFLINTKIQKTKKIKDLAKKLKSKNKEETLKNIYNYVQKTYSSERYKIPILLYKHFYYKPDKLLNKKQFLPCHVKSLILVTLLINTGQFSEKDLKKKIVMRLSGFIHQYYLVKINNKTFKVDPFYGVFKEL